MWQKHLKVHMNSVHTPTEVHQKRMGDVLVQYTDLGNVVFIDCQLLFKCLDLGLGIGPLSRQLLVVGILLLHSEGGGGGGGEERDHLC